MNTLKPEDLLIKEFKPIRVFKKNGMTLFLLKNKLDRINFSDIVGKSRMKGLRQKETGSCFS